jgi:hypothetical protein
MDLDPRPEERRTRDGEGPRWHVVREATLERDDHTCQRCQRSVDAATDLAAYRPGDGGETYVLCEPCAGPLLAAGYDPADFEAAGDLDVAALASRADEAPVRPVLLAPGPARALRPPETGLERLVFDTPLRFLANPFGLTALFGGGGVFVSFWLF